MTAEGILLIDKPPGPTSHDVVVALRRGLRVRRIGHAGTLDPIASGLIVSLVGKATRFSQFIVGHRKRYLVLAVLNQMRDTYDRTGSIISETELIVTGEQMLAAVESFPRTYDQLPPAYSAKKIAGQRAYKLARDGLSVELEPRTVQIHKLELLDFDFPRCQLLAEVSAGTYIRSLVVDLARSLGTVGYVEELRRTAAGPFSIEDATALDEFLDLSPEAAADKLLPIDAGLADMPKVELAAEQKWAFANGQRIRSTQYELDQGLVCVYCDQQFMGLGLVQGDLLKPEKVIVR